MRPAAAEALERRLASALEALLATGMLVVFLVIVTLVVMRYLFQAGLVGANEMATVAFVYLSSVGAAVAVGRQDHIRVALLSQRLGRRGKTAVELAVLTLVALLNLTVVLTSIPWIGATGHIPMPASQFPRYLAQASVPLGCGLAALFCFTRMLRVTRTEPGP